MHLKIAILLLSAGAIAYQILLIRIFSIVQWHHFAAMIISLALLGYGMSGAVLTGLAGWLSPDHPRRWQGTFIMGSVLFGILSLGCAVLAQRIPFNPLAVVWDGRQFLYLLAVYLLLTIPFFFAATAIGVALMSRPGSIGGLYGADLLGAGIGAGILLAALYWWSVSTCLQIVGALGCLAGGVFACGYLPDSWVQEVGSAVDRGPVGRGPLASELARTRDVGVQGTAQSVADTRSLGCRGSVPVRWVF